MEPQCQFYVVRKKRLCRMTVRPGNQYCGEHNPLPKDDLCKDDSRIPCPNDPKHTCYVRRLQKHLSICNARPLDDPDYIVRNVNCPPDSGTCWRRPLTQYTRSQIQHVIDKINCLYKEHVEVNIENAPEMAIHNAVLEEFTTVGRTESSLRHLRQASSILHLVEAEGLVKEGTCYVELGAGKGQLSVFAAEAWCGEGDGSSVMLVERAALRHKRDNRLRAGAAHRLRADLAHLVLGRTPAVRDSRATVALAKHLCGVATDYALRCVVGAGDETRAAGLVMATCCHHRCELSAYVGELQELGISDEEFNIMLGVVSWATCGHGRSRRYRGETDVTDTSNDLNDSESDESSETEVNHEQRVTEEESKERKCSKPSAGLAVGGRAEVGRRAKAVVDWGRVMYLRRRGWRARLCHFVPRHVSLENVCIVATALHSDGGTK
ncbi:PREDICTED: tRNA:m(4)X modification enzyme TRM13 homolog isoform X2 [Papilio xuthus]|uniref:tRNA:m(4)X modification enzyme TRM13 n=1 Tax=Papilio xuthus TaxID=66420 RepID=A0AAJ7EC51_PAPXU|nr:PREDICTED: tRNA:m(4)X modification enzyme TRM13 homolog isoform X2 [Papilio xuthus]